MTDEVLDEAGHSWKVAIAWSYRAEFNHAYPVVVRGQRV